MSSVICVRERFLLKKSIVFYDQHRNHSEKNDNIKKSGVFKWQFFNYRIKQVPIKFFIHIIYYKKYCN